MIIDDLYIAIRDRLLATPSLGIATIDWNNGQPEQWESGEGKMDPLKLPCVLVRYDPPVWRARGRKHYEAEGVIYLDVVQRNLDEPFTSDRRSAKVQKRRDSYAIVQAIGRRLVGMRGVGYGTFGLIGMEQDHDFSKLRVDTIAFRSLLCTDMDPQIWTPRAVPDLVINTYPNMPVPSNAIIVVNSDASYSSGVLPPGTFILPNVTHINSDGQPRVLPAMTPMICTPSGGECAPATVQLRDSDGNLLGSPVQIPSGGNIALTAPNSSYSINGTAAGQILSNGTVDIAVRDEDGQPRGTYEEQLGAHIIGDTQVQRRDSAGAAIGRAIFFRPESTNDVLCPDGTVTGRNSLGASLGSVAVKSGGVADLDILDSSITRPDGTAVGLPAGVALDVRSYRSGIAYQFGHALWSDQSTSYRTGDEGWLWQNGWYDYDAPVYPTHYARLGANRLTLRDNNIHGNTNRFTDRNGGQTYALGIVQDHLYGIEISITLYSAVNWYSAIDAPLALTLGGDSDWVCMPPGVLYALANMQTGATAGVMNFAPFSISNTNFWTSGTYVPNTANGVRLSSHSLVNQAKTNTNAYMVCRKFV